MPIIGNALLNVSTPNAFEPNQTGFIADLTDAVTPSDAIVTALDMVRSLTETVTPTDAVAKEFGINPSDTVKLTDWTLQKKTGQDFTG